MLQPSPEKKADAAGPVPGKWPAFALYVALTLLLAYPVSVNPGTTVAGDGGPDTQLFMWTLAWDTHALVSQPLSIFDANIYYPEPLTLAYSENLIGSALFAAPVIWSSGNLVLALNVVVLLSCALCGLGAYVLGRRVGLSAPAALVCGLIFAFTPPRFFRITQLHLTAVQWIPFALASLHAYRAGGRPRDLRFAAGFFTLQALTSGHGAVFLVVGAACVIGVGLLLGDRFDLRTKLRDLGLPGALLLLPSVLVVVPYRMIQGEMGLTRSLENWAATPESFLASPARLQTWILSFFPDARVNELASAYLFPGYLPILLAIVAIASWRPPRTGASVPERPAGETTSWNRLAIALDLTAAAALTLAVVIVLTGPVRVRLGDAVLFSARDPVRAWIVAGLAVAARAALARRVPFTLPDRLRRASRRVVLWRHAQRPSATMAYAVLTLVSLGLAAGPPLSLWPLVYWLPGFDFIRGPSRFMVLGVLGLAVLAGIGFERFRAWFDIRWHTALAFIVGLLLVVEFAAIPIATVPVRVDVPDVDRWLAAQPGPFVVAELPLLHSEALHTRYMLHSTAHWQRTLNGYSGTRPPLHTTLFSRLRGFPDEYTVQSLVDLGVDYVVIHTDLYPPGEWEDVKARLALFSRRLKLEYAGARGLVYSVHSAAGT